MADLDELVHHIPAVLGSLVGSYLAVRRHYKQHEKRLKAVEQYLDENTDFVPAREDVGLEGVVAGALGDGKDSDE